MYKEVKDDIWNYPDNIKVITTNGNIKKNGNAVLGKGIALQASRRFQDLAFRYANHIKINTLSCAYYPSYKLILFPTKYNYWQNASLILIRKSMEETLKICKNNNIKKVIMPKVGCGNGLLYWNSVKRTIEDILMSKDIEFVIVG